jgi:hypothetical protein
MSDTCLGCRHLRCVSSTFYKKFRCFEGSKKNVLKPGLVKPEWCKGKVTTGKYSAYTAKGARA